jgi:hypothetical protein
MISQVFCEYHFFIFTPYWMYECTRAAFKREGGP